MTNNPLIKPLGITAAILGIIQGVVWLILSIIALIIYFEGWKPTVTELSKTYGQVLSYWIMTNYVKETIPKKELEIFIRPREFYIWCITYLIVCTFWIGLSIYLLVVLLQEKIDKLRNSLLVWGICTSICCILDLLLTGFLASDYNTIVGEVNTVDGSTYTVLACGIVMTLAAKGFVLWFINFIFTAIAFKFYADIPDKFSEDKTNSKYLIGQSSGHQNEEKENGWFGVFQKLPRVAVVQTVNQRFSKHNLHSPTASSNSLPRHNVSQDYSNHSSFMRRSYK